MLMTTMAVKAQTTANEEAGKVVVDSIAYALDKTAKTAAVVPSFYFDENKKLHFLCDSYAGDISVPATIAVEGVDYTVTELAEDAFWSSDVTSLSLPSTIKKLGINSIGFCTQLKKVNIPASVEEECDEGQIYGVDGAQRTTLSRGLNIMRSKEGTRKILCN